MRDRKSQQDVVIDKLTLDGHVSNFWAIENYILRLGAIICQLRKQGWEFETSWGKDSERKNYYYTATKKPELTLFK